MTDSNSHSADDPFCELRLYAVAPGRIRDMERRAQEDLCTLFPRHDVHPLGTWSCDSGPQAPLFVYLTPWRHMQQRTRSWGNFAQDPDWAEARARTNGSSELVERYDILFLRAAVPWQAPDASGASRLFELSIQEVATGQTPAVRRQLLEAALPALRQAGAQVHGVYDVMSGKPLPSVVTFCSWPDYDTRTRAEDALAAQQGSTGGAAPRALLGRADHYLMRSVPVTWR